MLPTELVYLMIFGKNTLVSHQKTIQTLIPMKSQLFLKIFSCFLRISIILKIVSSVVRLVRLNYCILYVHTLILINLKEMVAVYISKVTVLLSKIGSALLNATLQAMDYIHTQMLKPIKTKIYSI